MDEARPARAPGWTGLPPLLVIGVLVALLLVPYLVRRQIEPLQREIDASADPARTVVTEIQYRLARQTAALRGYLITTDATLLERYRAHSRLERIALDSLELLTRPLGPEVRAAYGELRDLSITWHARIEDDLATGARPRSAVGSLPFEESIYHDALQAGARLDQAIHGAIQARREQIQRIERIVLFVNGVLITLALAAMVSVTWLSHRVRRLAEEAEARRGEAERALRETARAVESRSMLMRGVTHDVKNPLGAVDGYAEILALGLKGELSGAQAEVVAKMRRAVRSALDIIDDLLELSRAETGGLPLRWERVDLGDLVGMMVEQYQGPAQASGLQLAAALPESAVSVTSDPERVGRILGNLLSNAVKYTPSGGHVVVSLSAEEEGPRPDRREWAAIRVRDDGPGVPEEAAGRIFDEFFRVPGSRAAGHGLGLAISRRVARLLGGDLTLQSTGQRGSTFTLWLPMHGEPEEPRAGASTFSGRAGQHIV